MKHSMCSQPESREGEDCCLKVASFSPDKNWEIPDTCVSNAFVDVDFCSSENVTGDRAIQIITNVDSSNKTGKRTLLVYNHGKNLWRRASTLNIF